MAEGIEIGSTITDDPVFLIMGFDAYWVLEFPADVLHTKPVLILYAWP